MAITKSLVMLAGAMLAGLVVGSPAQIPSFTAAQIDSGEAIRTLGKLAYDAAMARVAKATTGCTKENVRVRKEW
jgi:tyrosinase